MAQLRCKVTYTMTLSVFKKTYQAVFWISSISQLLNKLDWVHLWREYSVYLKISNLSFHRKLLKLGLYLH